MKKNVGKTDAFLRLVGMIIIGIILSFAVPALLGVVLSALALILLFTASFETCPLYSLLGISTRKQEATNQ